MNENTPENPRPDLFQTFEQLEVVHRTELTPENYIALAEMFGWSVEFRPGGDPRIETGTGYHLEFGCWIDHRGSRWTPEPLTQGYEPAGTYQRTMLLMNNDLQQARIGAAARVLAPDGVFAESFAEYSRKRDNYRPEDQYEEQVMYLEEAALVLAAAYSHLPTVEQIADVIHDWLCTDSSCEIGATAEHRQIAMAVRALFGEVEGDE